MSVFAVIIAVVPCVAGAHYPGGWDGGDSPEHMFWDCHMVPGGPPTSCCGTSNGYYLEADQWRVITDGEVTEYEINIGTGWAAVPEKAVLHDRKGCGDNPNKTKAALAMVWYNPKFFNGEKPPPNELKIICFRPGSLG